VKRKIFYGVSVEKDFEVLPHTADIKIKAYGRTLQQFFCNALLGMFQSVGPIIPECKKKSGRVICDNLPQKRKIEVRAPDIDALLVDFLSEALYLSDVHDEAYFLAEISEISETSVSAVLHGIRVKGFDVVEIKAVTYHELEVKNVNGVWQSYIVFDI